METIILFKYWIFVSQPLGNENDKYTDSCYNTPKYIYSM